MTEGSRGAKIAVVDDDQRVLGSLEILLESADHVVRSFASGAALLASDCLAEIRCLISDIDMPGMDGFQLTRLVHTARPELPIILITAHPVVLNGLLPADSLRCRLFKKPFNGAELLTAVNDALAAAA